MQYPLSEVFPCLDTGPASCPCQEDLCWPHINSVPAPPSALLAGPQVSSVLASTSLLGVGDHHLCSRPLLWPAVHCNIQLLYQFNAWELTPASPEIWSLPLYFLMSSSSRVEQHPFRTWDFSLKYLTVKHIRLKKSCFYLCMSSQSKAHLALQLFCTKGNTATSWRTLPDECSDGTSPCGTDPETAEEQQGIFWCETVSCYSIIMACS